MAKRVAAVLPIVLALGCGGDDAAPVEGREDARTDLKNACGGQRPLAFLGRPASPTDPCGACGGTLVCAAPEMLVCIGSTDASCADGGTSNLCGGRGPLMLDGMPATPGKPCGPCRDGMTFCAAPEIVACVGASRAAACDAGTDIAVFDALQDSSRDTAPIDVATADAPADSPDTSVDSASSDATGSDAPPDSSLDSVSADITTFDTPPDASLDSTSSDTKSSDAPDSSLDSAPSDTGVVDAGPINACGGQGPLRYQGVDASPGDKCGTCGQGTLACASPTTLTCTAQPTSDVCNDVAVTNACGGTGPLYWRGVPTAQNMPCGPCNGFLRCASPTQLVCRGPVDCPSGGCDVPISAYSAKAPTLPAPPAETAPTSTTAIAVTLAVNGLLYNPFDFRLYASVASAQGTGGNAIAVIDPSNGTIVRSIPVGSEPKAMALSDDGKALWVALDGEGAVRRVDTVNGTAGLQFSLGSDSSFGPWYAHGLAVLPGTQGSVVVARVSTTVQFMDGAVIYDDGVPRAYASGMMYYDGDLLVPTYAPELVFGFDTFSTGHELSTLCVNASGLFFKQTVRPFPGNRLALSFAENVIYSSSGIAYDIASGGVRGTFAGRGPAAPDAPKRRVYYAAVATGATSPTVSAYDMDTFLPQGSETLAFTVYSSAILSNFVRWGRYGYAFRVNSQSIIIARSALVAATP